MSRRTRLLTGLSTFALAAALLLVPTTTAPAATAAAQVTVPAPAYTSYVALGDSYSAGPLVEPQWAAALSCLRSTNNYPGFLAMYFRVPRFTDVTCSGADTGDMFGRQKTIVPGPSPAPQLDALRRSTDVVTLGIGGNDFSLFGSMISECEKVAVKDPKGAPCRDKYTVKGVDTKKRDARRIQRRVARVVIAIKKRSPKADVFVFGYPRLLPVRGTCAAVPFAKGDYRWGNEIERILNRSIRDAATNHGATYIDSYPASVGHHACAGDRAWINGSKIDPLRAANFHPFLKGMRGVARSGYRQITGRTAPAGSIALPLAGLPTTTVLTPAEALGLGALLTPIGG